MKFLMWVGLLIQLLCFGNSEVIVRTVAELNLKIVVYVVDFLIGFEK